MILLMSAVSAQDETSRILFANHSDLHLTSEISIEGHSNAVTPGKDNILPWENAHYHDISDRVAVTILNVIFGLDIDHHENGHLAKFKRLSFFGNHDYNFELEIKHEGELIFTITTELIDMPFSIFNPVFYNVKYPDGAIDAAPQWSLLQEFQNSPHNATRQFEIDGKNYKLIYGTFQDEHDITNNVIYSFSEIDPENFHYDPPAEELDDPAILNVVTYNIGLLMPAGANDQEEQERIPVLHQGMPKNMDVIIWQEMFEQEYVNQIIDSMAADYPYVTTPHNFEEIPNVSKNGGVLIMSKYPILEEDQFSYIHDAGILVLGDSRWADKGVKYARIEKHGQTIHVFGTHTGGQAIENDAMGRFMRSVVEPNYHDIVIMGGDMNTGLYSQAYYRMLDSLHSLEPTYLTLTNPVDQTRGTTWGFNHYGGGRSDLGRTIDYFFTSADFKVPTVYTNDVQAYRLNIDNRKFWGVFDLGDHQPVYCRFEFPTSAIAEADSHVCPGDDLILSLTTDLVDYDVTWFKDDELIEGENELTYSKADFGLDDYGTYRCEMLYSYEPDLSINSLGIAANLGGPHEHPGSKPGKLVNSIRVRPDTELCNAVTTVTDLSGDQLFFYPNPVVDFLYVNIPAALAGAVCEVSIFNQSGQLFGKHTITGTHRIDSRDWPSGIYVIEGKIKGMDAVSGSFVKM